MKEKQIGGVTVRVPETQEELTSGEFGHLLNKRSGLGYYVPAVGFESK